MFKKHLFLLFFIFIFANPAFSLNIDDVNGSFSERSLIMRAINGQDKMNQQDRDSLAEKKLTPTIQCMLEQIRKNNYENLKTLLDAKVNPNNSKT